MATAGLSLFPARVKFVKPDGTLTDEGYRALQSLFVRVGGSLGNFDFDNLTLSGNATIAGTLNLASGTAALPSINWGGNTSTGFYRIAANNVGYSVSGVNVLSILSTGLTINGTTTSTSFTGAGTGLTGTASGLTAGNVTTNANLIGMVTSVGNATTVVTNANLTGPITSVGNATVVASQTGTGSTFVMNTSPTLVTPALGAATATSLQSPIGNVTPNTGVFSTLRAANDESTRLQADTVNGGGARLWVRRAESIGGTAGTAGVGLDCLNTAEGGLVPLYVRASNTTISGTTTVTGNLTVPGGASVIFTSTALTNGAGAAAGTITNAPAAGNPTKWIGINDNGTVRYIPTW